MRTTSIHWIWLAKEDLHWSALEANPIWSGDTETCVTCPSLSLWSRLLPHVIDLPHLSAVNFPAMVQTSQVHVRAFAFAVPSAFNILFLSSHTTPSLDSCRSQLKCHLIRETFPEHTFIAQIYTAALSVTLLQFRLHSTHHHVKSKGQPLLSRGQLFIAVNVDISVQIFWSFQRSWKFWFSV